MKHRSLFVAPQTMLPFFFFVLGQELFRFLQDGEAPIYVGSTALNPEQKDISLGKITVFKDITAQTVTVKVYYNPLVNCSDVNIFHYKLQDVNCNTVKMGSRWGPEKDWGCFYELQCNHGDVTCTIELLMAKQTAAFSIGELIVT